MAPAVRVRRLGTPNQHWQRRKTLARDVAGRISDRLTAG